MKLLKYCLWHLLSVFNVLIILPLFLSPVNPPLAVISILFPLFVPIAIFFSRNETGDKNKDLWVALNAFCVDFVLGTLIYIIYTSAILHKGDASGTGMFAYILYLIVYLIIFSIVNGVLIGILKLKQKSLTVTK